VKIRQGIAPAIVAIGFGTIVAPQMAEAHTANAYATCTEGLVVKVESYSNPTTSVTIDGATITFQGNATNVYSLGSQSAPHTYTVVVQESDTTEYRYTKTETVPACIEGTTTTEAPATTTTDGPGTTAGSTTTTLAPPDDGATSTTTAAGPTTTSPAVTTTTSFGTVGGQRGPGVAPPTSPTRAAATTGTLPATGSSSGAITAIASVLVAAGGALWFAGRRPRRATD
jgi:LPXTG-motif cell wall-anchored protein